MRRRLSGRMAGSLLGLVGYLAVSGQSLAHGYTHLERAHHAGRHATIATEHATLSALSPAADDDDRGPEHAHSAVGTGVLSRTVTAPFVAIRPALVELPLAPLESRPQPVTEPRTRRTLPTTAPPRLRAPPIS